MRPKERGETGQTDLFRARLDQIVDPNHPLVKFAGTIDWSFLEQRFGAVYDDDPGRPPLPTRLMPGLAILKHLHDLSDEALCARWLENPYVRLFCGEAFFQHQLPFERSSLTRWRQRRGEERLVALLQEPVRRHPHRRRQARRLHPGDPRSSRGPTPPCRRRRCRRRRSRFPRRQADAPRAGTSGAARDYTIH